MRSSKIKKKKNPVHLFFSYFCWIFLKKYFAPRAINTEYNLESRACVYLKKSTHLRQFNPKTDGGGGQFEPQCSFAKNVCSKERVKPWFFMTFNIIIRHVFPKNFIEVTKNFFVNTSYYHQFSSIFRIFWHFLVTKKLMTSAYNR